MLELKEKILYELYNFILLVSGAIPAALIRWHLNNSIIVNLTGSLLIGLLLGASARRPFKLFLGVGFCGSLTTFSNWMMECLQLILHGSWLDAIAVIFSTLIAALFCASIGYWFGKQFRLRCFS